MAISPVAIIWQLQCFQFFLLTLHQMLIDNQL